MNEKRRYPAYSNSDLRLTGTDMVIELEIPEINTVVIYTDSSLSIKLPYELFSGNTEGQCGEFIRMFGNSRWKKQFNGYNSNGNVLPERPITTWLLLFSSQHISSYRNL